MPLKIAQIPLKKKMVRPWSEFCEILVLASRVSRGFRWVKFLINDSSGPWLGVYFNWKFGNGFLLVFRTHCVRVTLEEQKKSNNYIQLKLWTAILWNVAFGLVILTFNELSSRSCGQNLESLSTGAWLIREQSWSCLLKFEELEIILLKKL